MTTQIDRSINIDAPPRVVFDHLTDLHSLTKWSTITSSHHGPSSALELGQEFEQSIRVAGVPLRTKWRCIEYDAPSVVGYEATGPAGGTLHMRQTVRPSEGGSDVRFVIRYDLPGGMLGGLLDGVYGKSRNERETEHSLQNLKALVERRAG